MRSQGFGCSPIKKSRELGLDRTGSNTKVFELVLVQSKPHWVFVYWNKEKNQPTRRRSIEIYFEKLTDIGRTPRCIVIRARAIPREVTIVSNTRRDYTSAFLRTGRSYSPILRVIEDNKMRETGWSPIYCRRRYLKRFVPSTRGPGWTDLWSVGCHASGTAE